MAYNTNFIAYKNRTCPICEKEASQASYCRMHEATVCMIHCESCQYLYKFMGGEWHCLYRRDDDREKQIVGLYEKHNMQRKNAILESMTQTKASN